MVGVQRSTVLKFKDKSFQLLESYEAIKMKCTNTVIK